MIKEIINNKNVGITYFKHKWLQEITTNSGELAKENEYQVHFWAICLREVLSDSYLDHIYPVVFYNYPQKVSGYSIECEAKDIQQMSDKTLELAKLKAKEFLNEFGSKDEINLDNYEIMLVPMCTMHRHP